MKQEFEDLTKEAGQLRTNIADQIRELDARRVISTEDKLRITVLVNEIKELESRILVLKSQINESDKTIESLRKRS